MSRAAELCRYYDNLKARRLNFDSTYQEIVDNIDPHHADITTQRDVGQKKNQLQFDGSAPYASGVFADFYQSSVFNQNTKWWSIRHRDDAINQKPENAAWYNKTRDTALTYMRGFYSAGGQAIADWSLFGNGPVLVEEVPERKQWQKHIKYTAIPWGRYVMAEGVDGSIDQFISCWKMPAYNIVKRWGADNVSDDIRKAAEKADTQGKEFDILHAIMPRDQVDYSRSKIRKNTEYDWSSCWIELAKKKQIAEDGYRKFPVAVARMKLIPGEVYARGLGEVALPDAKSLNRMDEMSLLHAGRELDPPMLVRRNSIIGGILSTAAKGRTIVSDINTAVRPMFDGSNMPAFEHMQERKSRQIFRVFHVDEILNLLAHESPQLTAFEVNARLTLLQQILGPVFGQNDEDFFRPILDITMDDLAHLNLLTPAPDDIAMNGKDAMDFVYEGPLARAQRNQELVSIQQSFADTSGMAQLNPELLLMVDWDKMHRRTYEIRGTSDLLLGDDDYIDAVNAQRKAKDEAQQAATLAAGAQALGQVAPALKEIRAGAQGAAVA